MNLTTLTPLAPTLLPSDTTRRTWDAIVVGAGPAGASAAYHLARLSFRVLLVDRAHFPRWKVCGSCLTRRAQTILAHRTELRQTIDEATPLTTIRLAASKAQAVFPTPGWMAISRERFDAALIRAAIDAGSDFLDGAEASLQALSSTDRRILLRTKNDTVEASTKLILAADGLGGRLLSREFHQSVRPDSRVGVGAVVHSAPDFYLPNTVFMSCARLGYLGLVRLEDGRLDLAAAFAPAAIKAAGTPARAAKTLVREAGWPSIPAIDDVPWRGTLPLTRRPSALAAERLFLLGDAAGYIEPFTGEGMTWALKSAEVIAPLAAQAIQQWNRSLITAWSRQYQRQVARHQRFCRSVAWGLRHPLVFRSVLRLLRNFPHLGTQCMRQIGG